MMAFIVRPFASRGLFRYLRHDFTRTLSSTVTLASAVKTNPHDESKQNHKAKSPPLTNKSKPPDEIEYIVNFKQFDVKKIFKEFYSVYGPLFVVCHIGVSLISLGFFCSLTWLVVDPTKLIPGVLEQKMSSLVMTTAGTTSKFVVAYAMHKLILPVRLGTAVWATRRLATRVEFLRKRVEKVKKG